MKTPVRLAFLLLLAGATILSACGAPRAATQVPEAYGDNKSVVEQEAPMQPASGGAVDSSNQPAEPSDSNEQSGMPGDTTTVQTGSEALTSANSSNRMIIKNGEVKLQVEDTEIAIDRTLQITKDLGGYVISSKVWYQEHSMGSFKYASITLGMPSDQFETAIRRLRGIAIKVLDENASGQDVSDEYVDLQSKLTNLEATRDRIRSFLDEAKTVEESLKINQELSTIEAEIEKVKGRMNYLSNRAAYSTITVTLEPQLPPLTPTPTPTITPSPTPATWNPGKTVEQAGNTLVNIYQAIIELLIWIGIVVVPVVLPIVLILYLIFKALTRKK